MDGDRDERIKLQSDNAEKGGHPPSAEMLAVKMLDLPEGIKVAIVHGMDGEGREFFSLSDPMIDPLQFPREEQMDMKMMEAYSGYTAKDIKDRKKVVAPNTTTS